MLSSDLFWFMEFVFWECSGPKSSASSGRFQDLRKPMGHPMISKSEFALACILGIFGTDLPVSLLAVRRFFTKVLVFEGSWMLPPIVALHAQKKGLCEVLPQKRCFFS